MTPIWQCILIDSDAELVTLSRLTFAEIRSFCGGDVEVGYSAGPRHVLLVDEDGLRKRYPAGFALARHPFVGNGVIVGVEGSDFCDCALSLAAAARATRFFPGRKK
jgi:hypothetical protein